ncbi:unnamed protein product [Pylaiella littoralis]
MKLYDTFDSRSQSFSYHGGTPRTDSQARFIHREEILSQHEETFSPTACLLNALYEMDGSMISTLYNSDHFFRIQHRQHSFLLWSNGSSTVAFENWSGGAVISYATHVRGNMHRWDLQQPADPPFMSP